MKIDYLNGKRRCADCWEYGWVPLTEPLKHSEEHLQAMAAVPQEPAPVVQMPGPVPIELNTITQGNCLDLLPRVASGSVDMVLCDLPYGTTACKWDSVIPFAPLWEQYGRIVKPHGALVFTASQPFTTALIASNLAQFHHAWVWDKRFAANYPQAKRQPLKVHEDVVVFGTTPHYFPQMVARDVPIKKGANKGARVFRAGLEREDYAGKVYDQKYPESILEISSRSEVRGLHPTQKPVALFEYLIRTYTNEGDTVLDNCAGSGTTAVACQNTGRNFICFELDAKYGEIARSRLKPVDAVPAAA